jgi:undecaprenyl pyrophosphate phosphatase UppP
MSKKKVHTKAPKYKSFKLHGKYNAQRLFWYIVVELLIAIPLGLLLQSQIIQVLASY